MLTLFLAPEDVVFNRQIILIVDAAQYRPQSQRGPGNIAHE
jgi:hypothetical protein